MPNLGGVNSLGINGESVEIPDQAYGNHGVNTCTTNAHALNAIDRLEYTVSAPIMSFSQEVAYSENGSGLIMSFEQDVSDSGVGNVCSLSQIVYTSSVTSFLSRNGYYPMLYINGRRIPDNQIHDVIKITRTENDAAAMEFTLLLPDGTVNLESYEGQSVVLNVQTATGIYRRYTGKVNIPDLDFLTGKLHISCTDNRRELINARPGLTALTGWYSRDVFGVSKDLAQELDYRLTTIPYTVNFNAFGVPNVSNIFASAVADFTYTQSDIYRDAGRDPHVIIAPRARIVNTINIDMEYRYQRLFRTICNYSWGNPINCQFLIYGYSLCKRDVILGAAQSCGWPIVGSISVGAEDSKGWYNCGYTDNGLDKVSIGFSWIEFGVTNEAATETNRGSDGQLHTTNVVDSKGNQVYDSIITSAVNHQNEYATGAGWTCAYKWSQNITENYTVSVTSPQSIARFGTVSQDMSCGIESKYDSSKWNDNSTAKTLETVPSGFVKVGSPTVFYANEISNYGDYVNAMYTLIAKAQTTILKSHRENKVVFHTPFKPLLDLHHTVEIDATSSKGDQIQAKGKVYQIIETFPVSDGREATTQVTLALSLASGSATDTPFTLPTRPSNILEPEIYNILLGTYMGVDPDGVYGRDKAGFFGNRWRTVPSTTDRWTTNTYRTQYSEQFRVDTPEIPTAYTDNVALTGSGTYTVQLVNDDLTVVVDNNV